MNLQVVLINANAEASGTGRPRFQDAVVFVIDNASHMDRRQVREVLNSNAFIGKFGAVGSTQGPQIVLYCSDFGRDFTQFSTELFNAITIALTSGDRAWAH